MSGRPVTFLVDALALDGIVYAGLYGLERMVDGEVVVDPRAEPWLDVMSQVAHDADAAFPDLLVENKGRVAVTIHWRSAPSLAAEAQAFAAGLARRYDLDPPLRGRMSVELRPPVPVDKGTVTAELVRGASVAVFAGDDAGDLVAFDVLTRLAESGAVAHTIRIGVRSAEAPPGIFDADVLVDGPEGLAVVLGDLATEISARGSMSASSQVRGVCTMTSSRSRAARSRRSSSPIDRRGGARCAVCSTSNGCTASAASWSSA